MNRSCPYVDARPNVTPKSNAGARRVASEGAETVGDHEGLADPASDGEHEAHHGDDGEGVEDTSDAGHDASRKGVFLLLCSPRASALQERYYSIKKGFCQGVLALF